MCFVFCDRKIIYTNSLLDNTVCFVGIVFRIISGYLYSGNLEVIILIYYLKSNIYICTGMIFFGHLSEFRHLDLALHYFLGNCRSGF